MATRSKPYEQLGRYILFKRLDATRFLETWRGAGIEGERLGSIRLIHRFTGGDLQALRDSIVANRSLVPSITGTTVVREQQLDIAVGAPIVIHEYTTGRTLRHIVDRARTAPTPSPIPTDQAIAITERLALSVETLNSMKYGTTRLVHGSIIPSFVWISDEGDVRLAGHLLSEGLVASLRKPETAPELSPYVAPEIRGGGQATKASDVYSLGAIFYLLLTGQEPPDPADAAAHATGLSGARMMGSSAPIPGDIRPILDKSLALDPTLRFQSAQELRQAFAALLQSGAWSATTFNLAFYLSGLLKKELEAEAGERQREEKLNLAPYLEPPAPASAAEARAVIAPTFGQQAAPERSRLPLIAGLVFVIALAAAGGAWWFVSSKKPAAAGAPVTASASAPVPAPKPVEPIFESVKSETAPTATGTVDPEAQKQAFEDAVNRKLREEMLKLQAEFDARNKPQAPASAPAATLPDPVKPTLRSNADERQGTSAEQLDQSRRDAQQPAPATQTAAAPAASSAAAQPPVPAPQVTQAAAAAPAVNEGDLIGIAQLDQPPKVTRRTKATYPRLAARQKIEGYIFLSVLITEAGRVADVRVLRGDAKKIGFEEAAIESVRSWQFTPGMKDGKRVRTWMPIAVDFKLQ